ncbi:transposase domain-containing protein [Serratia bockelmannii]|uniref:transposase domain-containing protein n=1 Tax=Serratia bockelmannii TaxID=2703793 RepID=UPI003FA69410
MPKLMRYLKDGRLSLDNNRELRGTGDKAACFRAQELAVFANTEAGARSRALLYSLLGICKLNGVAPESYLRHVLDVIADWPAPRVSELLPWRVTLVSK